MWIESKRNFDGEEHVSLWEIELGLSIERTGSCIEFTRSGHEYVEQCSFASEAHALTQWNRIKEAIKSGNDMFLDEG